MATYQSLGALRDTTTDNKAKRFHSLHDPVFKSLSSAIKEAIFGNSLLVYFETIRQVAKIDHAREQGQIQCSNTCTLFLCQNLFPSSYFLSFGNGSSVSFFSALWSRTVLEIGLVAFFWFLHSFTGHSCRINWGDCHCCCYIMQLFSAWNLKHLTVHSGCSRYRECLPFVG